MQRLKKNRRCGTRGDSHRKINKFSILIISLITSMSLCANNNPFLQAYTLPYGAVPFEQISLEHYREALDQGLLQQDQNIQNICNNTDQPTFANTIEAMEVASEVLDRVSNVLFNLTEANRSDELDALAEEYLPRLTEASTRILHNEKLFERVQRVNNYAGNLTQEQQQLLENTYQAFVRAGARLNKANKDSLAAINSRLSQQTFTFGQNVLQATNAFNKLITNKKELKGIPQNDLKLANQKAKEKGLKGYLFDLSMPSYLAVMQYADNRELRETFYKAYNSKANGNDAHSNRELVVSIANNRLQMAQILGYSDYASFRLERTMAQNSQGVTHLLDELYGHYYQTALNEVEELSDYAKKVKKDESFVLQAWDWAYYSEKLKKERFNLSDEQLRPYFPLEQVKQGIFWLAGQLYGLRFEQDFSLPRYHKDVEIYQVWDNNGFLGLLYMDFYTRSNKQGGAWMTEFAPQWTQGRIDHRPLVSLVTNFANPTSDTPSLLSYNDVQTLLHEFGHCLHALFSEVHYPSLSGTNVYHDFVELPSQLMENFASLPAFLEKTAKHYKTGEALPNGWIESIKAANRYHAAYSCIRQLSFAYLDMAWHSLQQPLNQPIDSLEAQACRNTRFFEPVEGTLMSVQFNHLFSGGYAAGYYGYKWAEVLDADAFSVFEAAGGISRAVGNSFRYSILSKGGSAHPMSLYKIFRKGEPTIDALLKRDGILK